jgi:hypothetical protein
MLILSRYNGPKSKPSYYKWEEWVPKKEDGTKASKTNIKFCSSMSEIWGMW